MLQLKLTARRRSHLLNLDKLLELQIGLCMLILIITDWWVAEPIEWIHLLNNRLTGGVKLGNCLKNARYELTHEVQENDVYVNMGPWTLRFRAIAYLNIEGRIGIYGAVLEALSMLRQLMM
jgi:hypothetical protein